MRLPLDGFDPSGGFVVAGVMDAQHRSAKQIGEMTDRLRALGRVIRPYLSPRGRITREDYVLRFVAPWVVGGAGLSTVLPRPSITGSVLLALLFWAYLVGFAKRLQDLGFPGFPISGMIVLGLWVNLQTSLVFPAWLETYLYALFGISTLFAGSTSGEPGTNRFGPDPLSGAPT